MLAETTPSPFYEAAWFQFLVLLAVVGLIWFLCVKFASSIRMAEYGGRLAIISISLACALLVIFFMFPPKFGVDLRGGIKMIGQLNTEALKDPDATGFNADETITAQDIIPNLLRRVDPSGTQEIMIRALGTDKIEVTIPDKTMPEAEEIWYRLAKTGQLLFRIAADTRFHPAQTKKASELAEKGVTARTIREDSKIIARWYNLAREDVEGEITEGQIVPIKFIPDPVNQIVRDKRTGQLIDMMSFSLGNDALRGKRFAEQLAERGIDTPQILMIEPANDKMDVQGKHLSGIRPSRDETGKPSVNFDLNADGAKRMQRLTGMHQKRGEKVYLLGIVLDNQLHSAPTIQSTIHNAGRITGSFTKAEIDDLIINLRSGKIDVALNKNPISQQYIESSLGSELKQKGLWAIGSSFVLVLLFMVVYYRFAGIVAALALLMNLALILALIMAIRQPLTLTGLAGLVLTVGMSVDANVLIFERIREELGRGAALRMAIRNGFDKATVTIVDANVTTLITALVLYVIGTEQIKGFAVTLILGILMSMFTAIYCSRTIFEIAERKRWIKNLNMTSIGKFNFDFLGKRGLTFVLSAVLIVSGIVGIFSLGARILDHDLRGGSTAQVVFNQAKTSDEISKKLNGLGLEHKGEEVKFSVTEIQNPILDNVFKVDTNLPSFDGKEAEAGGETIQRWKQLDEILSENFAGELQLHNVEIGPLSFGQDDRLLNESGSYKPGLLNFTLPSIISTATFGPTVFLQDTGTQQDTPPGQDPAITQAESAESAAESTEPGIGAAVQDEETELPDDVLAPETGSTDDDPEATGSKANVAKFSLKFDNATSGKGIQRFLIQAGDELLDMDLDEEQITVIPDKVDDDATNLTTRTTDWTVEMAIADKADAEKLLNAWSADFNNEPYFPVKGGVGGQIAKETQYQALAAILASLLGIIAYVWIRFQNVAFGLAAVVALIHDVLIVLGAIALSHYVAGALGFMLIDNFKISLPVVAALLTIIGYSLNDTIVVFDRIREVRGKRSEMNEEMINTSISQTLSRTILTSLTTFIVVFILYVFGGDAIHGFAFALTIGVIVGTYSSIFVASPALLWLMNRGFSPDYDENGEPIKKTA
jgi:SecD/SecF fusion protein